MRILSYHCNDWGHMVTNEPEAVRSHFAAFRASAGTVTMTYASGIVINLATNELNLPLILVVLLVGVVYILGVAYEYFRATPGGKSSSPMSAQRASDGSIYLALAAFIIGVVITIVALQVPQHLSEWPIPRSAYSIHQYEVLSVAAISLLGAVAVLMKKPLSLVLIFGAAALTGMSIAIYFLSDDANNLTTTFLGWLVAYTAFVVVLSSLCPMCGAVVMFFKPKSKERAATQPKPLTRDVEVFDDDQQEEDLTDAQITSTPSPAPTKSEPSESEQPGRS